MSLKARAKVLSTIIFIHWGLLFAQTVLMAPYFFILAILKNIRVFEMQIMSSMDTNTCFNMSTCPQPP